MRLCGLGALALALSPALLQAADPAEAQLGWLKEINQAARTANYQGVVVYRNAQARETLRITHRWLNGEEREYSQSMGTEPREILRRGRRMTVIEPQARTVSVESQASQGLFPIMSDEAVQTLQSYYDVAHVANFRVAGRVCNNLAVRPRDAYRYGYELCIDSERRLPLRTTLRDNAGNVLEETMFWEISFPERITDAELAARTDTGGFQRLALAAADAQVQRTTWKLPALPPGFRLLTRELRAVAGAPGPVEHLLFGDGLSMVSVYSVNAAAEQTQGLTRSGGVHSYARAIGPFHVTVVGEVPEETVRLIGDGLIAPVKAE